MSVSSVTAHAAQAVAAQANKPAPAPAADAPHDGDGDDHAAPVKAAVAEGVGKVVDHKA